MLPYAALLLNSCLLAGCMSVLYPVEMPMVVPAMQGTILTRTQQASVEGLYVVRAGNEIFGDTVVLRFVRGHLCIYATQVVVFAENAVCLNADTVSAAGYFRASRSTRVGDLELRALPGDGGTQIAESREPSGLILTGYAEDDGSANHIAMRLERVRDLGGTRQFHIIGHRSGGRNSERLGRSENSIEMAMFAEMMGCTGIETDIHVTKDGELIIFHDDEFSPRTIRSTYILGRVKDFTLKQIRDNATLIYGERIPTLEEYLTAVVDSTTLNLVWLDVKVPEQAERILEIQQRALDRAKKQGRDLTILFGVPSTDVLAGYRSSARAGSTPVLCELSPDDVRSLSSCRLWAPRWTNGLQNDAVKSMQPRYQVVTWTLDSPDYMTDFIRNGHFDGILTNYPSMLAGLYYQYGAR